jgi:hypothetical protein
MKERKGSRHSPCLINCCLSFVAEKVIEDRLTNPWMQRWERGSKFKQTGLQGSAAAAGVFYTAATLNPNRPQGNVQTEGSGTCTSVLKNKLYKERGSGSSEI